MKKLLSIFAVSLGFVCSTTVAEVLRISPTLSLDVVDVDATFQELPEMGSENYLCLWSGEVLQAFLVTTHDEYDGDFASYFKQVETAMRGEGAKSIKLQEGVAFTSSNGPEVRRLDAEYEMGEQEFRQIYYAVKSETGYHSVVVTFTDPGAYDAIGVVTDKLMTTAALVSAGD